MRCQPLRRALCVYGECLMEEIMKDPDIEFSNWKLERKKGILRFVVLTSFPAILGVMIGRSIEPIFVSETAWSWVQTTEILLSGCWAAVGSIALSLVIWQWRERKYKRHIAQFKQHT